MKFFICFLILSMNSTYAANANKPKATQKTNYQTYHCKMKSLPLELKYVVLNSSVKIDIVFESDFSDYQILSARGVDGLKTKGINGEKSRDVLKDQKESYDVDYTKSDGLSYLVLDIQGFIDGKKKIQTFTIPIGKLSAAQINKRKENIIEVKRPGVKNALEKDENRFIHRTVLEKK